MNMEERKQDRMKGLGEEKVWGRGGGEGKYSKNKKEWRAYYTN